jgi:tetratricopeptide (TPR) repeat protein/DNA-binding CsgD family transcriptional regulator
VAREGGARVLHGSCIDFGGGTIPHAPLIEALRLLEREHGADGARRLAGPAWAVLSPLIADFTGAEPAPFPWDGEPGSRLRVFGPVLRLLDHLGNDAPVLLVFEDVHWADQATLDLISFLTRGAAPRRTLFVCSHRPVEQGHPLRTLLAEPAFARRTERLALSGLTEAELGRFLGRFGPADRDLVRRGHELSEGNPFLAEQLMRAGALAGRGPIPASISELMLTRVRELDRPAGRVLRAAATAARRVSDQLLAAVCKLDDEVFDEALHTCLDAGMLVSDPVEETYAVRHALLREAVYEQLLIPRERRRLHTDMAEALTADPALGPKDELSVAAELAHHWFFAGREAQALTAAVRAGALAAAVRGFREAERHYSRALDLWARVPDARERAGIGRDRLLMAAADAARWAGQIDRAVARVLEALDEVDPALQPQRAGELHERLGSFRWEAGAYAQAARAYAQAEELLAEGPPTAVRAQVLAGLALARSGAGAYEEALALARHAGRIAEQVDAQAELGRALNAEGLALTLANQAGEGIRLLRRALEIAERDDQLEDLFRVYGNLGLALDHTGDLTGSVEVALNGLRRIRGLGLVSARQVGVLANNAGATLSRLGRWDEAIELLDGVLENDPPVKESVFLRLTRAEIDVAQGRFDDAGKLLDQVLDLSDPDPRYLGPLYTAQADLLLWQGRPEQALAAVEQGLTAIAGRANVVERLWLQVMGLRALADRGPGSATAAPAGRGANPERRFARLEAARTAGGEAVPLLRQCAAERGRARGADTVAEWEAVAAAWAELGQRYPTAYARFRMAGALARAGDPARAHRVATGAAETARQLGAEPLNAAVRSLLAGEPAGPSVSTELGETPIPAADVLVSRLTGREKEVARLLRLGRINGEIAKELVISPSTAGVHVSNILRKLEVRNRTEAATLLVKLNLFDGDSD